MQNQQPSAIADGSRILDCDAHSQMENPHPEARIFLPFSV